MDKVIFDKFHQLRGHNSEVSLTILLVIKLHQNIMPISIVTKFGEEWVYTAPVRERTKSISTNFFNKGAITVLTIKYFGSGHFFGSDSSGRGNEQYFI